MQTLINVMGSRGAFPLPGRPILRQQSPSLDDGARGDYIVDGRIGQLRGEGQTHPLTAEERAPVTFGSGRRPRFFGGHRIEESIAADPGARPADKDRIEVIGVSRIRRDG
jgi:hypothetical protein